MASTADATAARADGARATEADVHAGQRHEQRAPAEDGREGSDGEGAASFSHRAAGVIHRRGEKFYCKSLGPFASFFFFGEKLFNLTPLSSLVFIISNHLFVITAIVITPLAQAERTARRNTSPESDAWALDY